MGILNRISGIFNFSEKRNTAPYIDPKTWMQNATSGAVVNKDTALSFTPVWCAVKLLSESVSQIPFKCL